ncbi:immediate-early gene product [Macaca mulatta rhadinovirus 17577]|uniref:Immediate-early gene product n=1 Tax=Macaca mulatta rhadinovirus 17577 TaxID=83534 RepID=Q9WRP5_9GAMA|nr:immediate-early gene product [Macacine gammaherpesvirus 5]AAD21383.1 immediate-early gene product [Macaca mulatta rhadinovirus 17577]WUF06349.1 immediate-early gene product [synthetic construct]WVG99658.1 immediate-early gene product [Macaca mulatta rhadinovirus]WSP07027.1 immediate-early protein [Macacine gammaherpesvirus 5]WUF06429.1 immediate-early gene product [synthetic construct]
MRYVFHALICFIGGISSSDFDDSSSDEMDDLSPTPEPEPSTTPNSFPEGPKSQVVALPKIRKRSRSETPVKIEHRSPLNRSRSRSRTRSGSGQRSNQSGRYVKRFKPTVDAPRHREPWHRGGKGKAPFIRRDAMAGRGRRTYGHDYRGKAALTRSIKESIKKMHLPSTMLSRAHDKKVFEGLLPRHLGQCFQVCLPAPPPLQPEVFTDRQLTAIVKSGGRRDALVAKKVSLAKLTSLYKPLLTFVTGRNNQAHWLATRKNTLASAGLEALAAFIEEGLAWAQVCVSQNRSLNDSNLDIILDSSQSVCTWFISKIRHLHIQCFLENQGEVSLVKQLTYLVCINNRLAEAANLAGEVKLNFKLGMLIGFALTLPALLAEHKLSGESLYLFRSFLEKYRPGDVMGLLNSIVVEHYTKCRSAECVITTHAMVGSGENNKGLFFFPV